MKKLFVLLLAAVICVLFAACGSNVSSENVDLGSSNAKPDSTTAASSPDSAEKDDENELVIIKNDIPGINGRRFPELVETVELTMENWADYIDFSFSTYHKENKDAFGEVISTTAYTSRFISAKTDKYFQFIGTEEKPAAIELKHKTTGKVLTLGLEGSDFMFSIGTYPNVDESFFEENSIDNYDCTRIQGTLYIVDMPEEVLFDTGDDFLGMEFYVYYPNGEYGHGAANSRKIHMVSVADILDNCN